MDIPRCFALKKDKKQENRERLKAKLLRYATCSGLLKCKKDFQWNNYFVIFTDAYLYFFKSDAETDSDILRQVYIKNSQVQSAYLLNEQAQQVKKRIQTPMKRINDDIFAPLHAFTFTLKNRYDQCEFACKEKKELIEWTKKLTEKVEEYATIEELIRLKEKEEEDLDEEGGAGDASSLHESPLPTTATLMDSPMRSFESSRRMSSVQLASHIVITMNKIHLRFLNDSSTPSSNCMYHCEVELHSLRVEKKSSILTSSTSI